MDVARLPLHSLPQVSTDSVWPRPPSPSSPSPVFHNRRLIDAMLPLKRRGSLCLLPISVAHPADLSVLWAAASN